jgi:hypothetical protein
MAHKFTILLLTAVFLAAQAIVLTADHAAAQGINYNPSKSNTGNNPKAKDPDPPRHAIGMTSGHGSRDMAVKGSGVPQNSGTYAPSSGGRRAHDVIK